MGTKSPTIKRILREAAELAHSPSPDFYAAPARDSDLFEWHFTLRGPPSSVFANGIYHGRIVLPPTYPLRPPSFRFLNPSGRFEVNREICLSISGHHEETWMPAWGVRTALVALRSFMETDPRGQLGGMDCTPAERERYAKLSVGWTCSVCQKTNEDILKECERSFQRIGSEESLAEDGQAPVELKIAFRDELTKEKTEVTSDTGLKETKTDPEQPITNTQLSSTSGISKKTSTTNTSTEGIGTSDHLSNRTLAIRRVEEDSPKWIDLVIGITAGCLLLMIMKVLLRL